MECVVEREDIAMALHTEADYRMDIRNLKPYVVDASGHVNPTGLEVLKPRILSEINVHDYDFVVSDSVLVSYAFDSETSRRVTRETTQLGNVDVMCQVGCGFACRWLWQKWSRFELPGGKAKILVITAGNDLFASGWNLAHQVRDRMSQLKRIWEPYGYVHVLVLEDDTWP